MKQLHENLSQSSPGYKKWHESSQSSAVHWLVVVMFAVGAGFWVTNNVSVNAENQTANTMSSSKTEVDAGEGLASLNNKLISAVKKYQKADNQTSSLNELIALATQRQDIFSKKIKSNQKEALLHAIPKDLLDQMPIEIQSLVEKEVDLEGTLSMIYIDYPKGGPPAELKITLEDSATGKKYNVYLDKDVAALKNGDKVKVHGLASKDSLLLALKNGNSTLVVTQTVQALVTGDQKTLAILINFQDNPGQPFTPTDVANALFNNTDSTDNYYTETSYGTVTFSGNAVGWYTINMSSATCDYNNFASAAKTAASQNGVNLNNYTRFVIVMPGTGACGWAGLGQVGSIPSNAWINGYINAFVYSHELGHNLGMRHSGSLDCEGNQIAASCTFSAYGDPYSEMGGSWVDRHVGAGHLYQMGWSKSQTVSSSGTYNIYPQEVFNANTQIIKISRADGLGAYYLEYRKAFGFDAGIPASMENVSVHLWNGVENQRLDMSPDHDFSNSALSDGTSFTDSMNGITVTQLSHDATKAVVQITMNGPACAKNNPQITISPVSQTGSGGATLSYTVNIKNNDTSTCGNTTFNLTNSVPSGFSSNMSATSATLNPGGSTNVTLSVTSPSGTPDGTNTFTVNATDSSDGSHAGSANGNYIVFTQVADTTAPSVSITSPAANASVTGNKVNVSASATDDIKLSKVELYIDNKVVKTCTTTGKNLSCTFSWNTKPVPNGNHTIMSKAYDAANNITQASITVVVR